MKSSLPEADMHDHVGVTQSNAPIAIGVACEDSI